MKYECNGSAGACRCSIQLGYGEAAKTSASDGVVESVFKIRIGVGCKFSQQPSKYLLYTEPLRMAFPCVEIAHSVATDAYRTNPTDPAVLKPALELVKAAEGAIGYIIFIFLIYECYRSNKNPILRIYHGLQVEDPKHAYVVNGAYSSH